MAIVLSPSDSREPKDLPFINGRSLTSPAVPPVALAALTLLVGLLLSGCEDYTRAVGKIVGYRGPDIYQYPCATGSLEAGRCLAPKPDGSAP
jgi:hypothetical protein